MINFIKDCCGWKGNKLDILENELHWNVQTKYFFFCHHGQWPRGEITIDIINSKLTYNNILKLSDLVDIFIETKNLNNFIATMSKYFNLEYISFKENTNKHSITFNDDTEKLLTNNKFDCFLLKTYMNDKNHEFNI